MSHRVLIITYLFPPSGGIGPPRYAPYARHLPAHGCEVSVITAKNPHTPLYDPGLLKVVPPETHVYRVFNPDVPYDFRDRIWRDVSRPETNGNGRWGVVRAGRWIAKEAIQRFFNPDVQRFWVPFVLQAARRVIRTDNIQTVILNTPPFSLHAIIPSLKQEFPKLKWITEVRDDWLGYYLQHFDSARTDAKYRLAVKLEGAGVRASDYLVAVTEGQRDMLRNRYPDQPQKKFLSVSNGFDAELFKGFRPARNGGKYMVVTYYGSLYATPPYDITGYLDAVDALPEEIRDCMETRFIGRIAREAEPLLDGRKSKIVKMGFFPREDGVRKLEGTDYLLLAANDPTTHGGKLFDYLASGLPIMALSPPGGEVDRLLRSTGAGVSVNGTNRADIREVLLDAFRRLRGESSTFPSPDPAAVAAFERKNLVSDLVRLTGIGAE